MLKILARHCGSTALAFSMHTHQVAIPAWRWRYQKVAAAQSLLKRVALERIVLVRVMDRIGLLGLAKPRR